MSTRKRAAEDKVVQPERLMDLIPFYIGFDAFFSWLEQSGAEPDALAKRGEMLARRYLSTLDEAAEVHLAPIIERSDAARLKAPFHRWQRSGSPSDRARNKANFLKLLFEWFRSHQAVFRTLFSGKSRKAGMSVMSMLNEDDPVSVVRQGAVIPAVSGLQVPRKWLAQVAETMGASISGAETTMADVESLANLATTAQQIDLQLAGAPPNSEKAAALAAEKAAVLAKMEENAGGDQGALQAAAAAAFKPNTGHRTDTGQRLSLNADQEAAMVATGKKVVAAGAGSGKCVVGDTLVQTAEGFISIGELGQGLEPEQDAPLEVVVHGKNNPELTSHIYFDGIRQTRKVVTRQGYEIEGTGPHKILTFRDGSIQWTPLVDLAESDVVCIDRRWGMFAERPFCRTPDDPAVFRTNATSDTNIPLDLTPQVASLLGWIVSEGYVRLDQWNISLTTTDPEQRDMYEKAVEGLVTPVWRAADVRALMGFGLTRALAGEKSVPQGILRSPKPVVAAFLRSLFDGDGGVTDRNIEYCTASEILAKQVHVLLTAFRIPSRRQFRPNNGQGAWRILIGGTGLRAFVDEIGFGLSSKAERLHLLSQKACNTNIDTIPGISHLCRTVRDQYAAKNGTTRSDDDGYGTFKCLIAGSRQPSFKTLGAFLDYYQVNNSPEWNSLKAICESGWFFDTVDEITEHVAPVYDFVVPGTHSFSAGGFINHNTRVLAGEVAYRVNELGYDASSICAVSFTRKASKELIKRVQDYGAVIDGAATSGFGTTHYLAGVTILGKYGKATKRPKYFSKKQQWAVTTLVAIAVRQVGMKGGSGQAPKPKNAFTDMPTEIPQTVRDMPVPSFAGETDPEIAKLIGIIDKGIVLFSTGWPSWFKGGDWGRSATQFLRDMKRKFESGATPADLSPGQRNYLNKLMGHIHKEYGVSMRVADHMDDADAEVAQSESPNIERKGNSKYMYWDTPARQWFNLGFKWEGAGDKAGNEGQQFSAAGVKRKIDIWKGMGATPEEVWYAAGPAAGKVPPYSPEAAAYAAYEWLKGRNGEPDFRNTGDMNDLLIDATRTLVHNDSARGALQSRFKVILVDEAQDLNRTQHVLFGLLAGALDPKTLQEHPDGSMTADTFGFIGDDKQCVDVDAPVMTPKGQVRAGDLKSGDKVYAYRNGKVVEQGVRHAVPSQWTEGVKVTTENGHSLSMSPNHRLWATSPETEGDQHVVYLMYREDMGFRVGITSKGRAKEDGYLNSFGGRAFLEKASKLWVLDITADRDGALTLEAQYSLRYGIPTQVFNGEHRGLNQDRINMLFTEFGRNGMRLLEERHLHPDFPHWMSQSFTKHGRERHTINLIAHSGSNSQVAMEWSGDKFDEAFDIGGLNPFGIRSTGDGRRRLRRWFVNYRDALRYVDMIRERTGAQVSHRLSTPEGPIREIPASGLFVGMSVPVENGPDGGIELDRIVSIEKVPGRFVDLDVDDASNFFAGGILTHNSIYEFRGAEPDEFIEKSNLVPEGGDFETLLLDTNYRSGQAIVEAANQLIKHNCVEISTLVSTPTGTVQAGEIQAGDQVLSYRNGEVVSRTVTEVVPSHWTQGIQITTKAGHHLKMSPNHRLWASEPILPEGHSAVYLMFRKDLGFRIGVTTKTGRTARGDDYASSLGARASAEHGERMWVLGMYSTAEEALYEETALSLRYSIPMTTFNAGMRGPDQERICKLFEQFGRNGMRLLEERLLSFDLPHWAAQSQRREDRVREVVSLMAHTPRGSTIWLKEGDGRDRVHRFLQSYEEAQGYARKVGEEHDLLVVEKLRLANYELRLLSASSLMPGMLVPVLHEGMIQAQEIARVDTVQGTFIDLGVEETCNFFGGGVLSHNSKQIPMTCKANYEVKGDGHIQAETFIDQADAADKVAESIADYAEANATADAKYSNYGIAVRSNAEAMHYALGMVKKAIPFKSKVNPFKSPPVKAMLGWMSLVEGGPGMARDAFIKAVSDALRMPASYLGKAFTNRLEKQSDPVRWLQSMDPDGEFQRGYAKNVRAFVDNLSFVFGMHGSPDSPSEVYNTLLTGLKSADGKTFFDGIVANIKENNDKMAELAAENPDGIPTDQQVEEAAEEELVLLNGLMGSKDSVDGVMSYVRELKAVNEKVAAGDDDDQDAVTIGTMHSWKGLEVPKLFIPLVRGKFPRVKLVKNPISGELECQAPEPNDPALASERRLAYVAITRAEDSCLMMDIGNPSKAFADCPPSQFISEACVPWAGAPDPAAEEEIAEIEGGHMASLDELTALWEDEYRTFDPEEPEFEPMLTDMSQMDLGPDPEDTMLAEWFKTTGKEG